MPLVIKKQKRHKKRLKGETCKWQMKLISSSFLTLMLCTGCPCFNEKYLRRILFSLNPWLLKVNENLQNLFILIIMTFEEKRVKKRKNTFTAYFWELFLNVSRWFLIIKLSKCKKWGYRGIRALWLRFEFSV